ncbi:hypothetical protein GQ457_03G011510 [Hibiscus cannabinus]
MELKGIFIGVLCFSFFALQTPCISLQIQSQSSNEQAEKGVQLSPPALLVVPRKLRFTEELAGRIHQENISSTKKTEDVSGEIEDGGHAGISKQKEQGRRQQWVGGSGDYFTTDYSGVRRRCPIHNKSSPVGP